MSKFIKCMFLIIMFIVPTTSSADTELVDILLLNSYHDGYTWSNETKQGIKDVLDLTDLEYQLRIEHMDTKNLATDDYLDSLYELYQLKFSPDEFDVIIAADDNAVKFLLKYRDELFGDTKVYFSGVNTLTTHDFENVKGFYGVVEKHSIVQTTEVALLLNPDLKDVYLFVDSSITGESTKRAAFEDMKLLSDQINFKVFDDLNLEQIYQRVSNLDPKTSIVIQAFYVVDKDGSVYPLDYTAKYLIKNSNVPVYGLFPFAFGQGSVGGKFLEGYTQGKRVAEMVVDDLNANVHIGEQFISDESFNRYYFDYNVLKQYNFDMDLLPDHSIIINKPSTFYSRNKNIINISATIVLLLMIYVFILRKQVNNQTKKITIAQKQLMQSEKMASLGRLVAGVAHEINTPIGIGVTLASYIKRETLTTNEKFDRNELSKQHLNQYLEDVLSSSEMMSRTMMNASKLIQSFKQVSVDQTVDDIRLINLEHYLRVIIESLRLELKDKSIKPNIHILETISLYTHSGALYQIILNLVQNSLKHGFDGIENPQIDISASLEKNTFSTDDIEMLRIVYRDNGVGIKDSHQKNIYDPFFTTKRQEGGSGLGMSIIYNLVTERLSGQILCDSVINEYTQFDITFPISNTSVMSIEEPDTESL